MQPFDSDQQLLALDRLANDLIDAADLWEATASDPADGPGDLIVSVLHNIRWQRAHLASR